MELSLTSRGRRYCLTESGDVGLVPPFTVPGDLIVVLKGARVPFLIRPSGGPTVNSLATYLLVGECYIHGIMRPKGCDFQSWAQSDIITLV